MGDVVEERRADADAPFVLMRRTGVAVSPSTSAGLPGNITTAAYRVRAGDEVAVRVGGDHRDVVDVGVDELEAEQVAAWALISPSWPCLAIGPAEELAGRDRPSSPVR